MAEFASDQVSHEDEVTGFAISSGARLGGLDQAVKRSSRDPSATQRVDQSTHR